MGNCWSIGAFLIIFLGTFCIWNCMTRDEPPDTSNWYGCRDQKGDPIDSFVVYKLPQNKHSVYKLPQNKHSYINPQEEGTAYMYLKPESAARLQSGGVSSVFSEYRDQASGWVLSNVSINSQLSMPARTLSRLYSDADLRKNAAYIMYNDEFPNGTKSFTKGHTKGVVVMTSQGGFWLVHSVPMYPPVPKDGYSYPHSGHRYGQTMLCITLPAEQTHSLGYQLLTNNPYIYASNMPSALSSVFPILGRVIAGDRPISPPWYRKTKLVSQGGKTFTSFAKYKKYNKDLYSELVAPSLESDLLVESWRNGPHPLPSSCNETYSVENIQMVSIRAAGSTFKTTHDHSKWAVTKGPDKPYVCIGDINRMETQFERAGGTVCLQSISIWHRFRSLVNTTEVCPRAL